MRGQDQDIHSLPYMPQLDGLRAISILLVLYTHYLPKDYWLFDVYWGGLGVRCFFVLSGFLITTILLRDIENAPSFLPAYGRFIARRMLRLYPVLLLTLLGGAALGVYGMAQSLPWTLTYTTNILASINNEWPASVAHLWTLAVEEQFYLLWPLVLFFTQRRALPYVLAAIIVVSPLFRMVIRNTWNDVAGDALAPACFDALALGAVLAVIRGNARLINAIGAAGLFLWLTYDYLIGEFGITGAAMVFMWIIAKAADGALPTIFDNGGLRYIGQISYGIYVLHLPVWVAMPAQPKWIVAAVTIGLASLSWHLIERPIMRFGRKLSSPHLRAA